MKSCYGFDLDTQEELFYTYPIKNTRFTGDSLLLSLKLG